LDFIPVAAPVLEGNEKRYVLDCLESTWISSTGKYIDGFERAFAQHCNADHAITCTNGTAALHLSLLGLGIGPGDEVIVPTFTYVAVANAVRYCGATPVFVDVDPDYWGMDPTHLQSRITERSKAIVAVHIFGHPCDMDPILYLSRRYGIPVLEDAAEAHGAKHKGRPVGTLGSVGTYSFYGNKIVTCGEGGMVVTNDDSLAARIRLLKGQGMDPNQRYWFPIVGYNYRMTNIAAAIGLAQVERIDWHLEQRRRISTTYKSLLEDVEWVTLQRDRSWAQNSYWMFSIVLNDRVDRDEVSRHLLAQGIETRPFFVPMHRLPAYVQERRGTSFPVADRIARQGLNLPSGAGLKDADLTRIVISLKEALRITAV
jgi:perosamine synthetase